MMSVANYNGFLDRLLNPLLFKSLFYQIRFSQQIDKRVLNITHTVNIRGAPHKYHNVKSRFNLMRHRSDRLLEKPSNSVSVNRKPYRFFRNDKACSIESKIVFQNPQLKIPAAKPFSLSGYAVKEKSASE